MFPAGQDGDSGAPVINAQGLLLGMNAQIRCSISGEPLTPRGLRISQETIEEILRHRFCLMPVPLCQKMQVLDPTHLHAFTSGLGECEA